MASKTESSESLTAMSTDVLYDDLMKRDVSLLRSKYSKDNEEIYRMMMRRVHGDPVEAVGLYGSNEMPTVHPLSFWKLLWQAWSTDKMILLLSAASLTSIVVSVASQWSGHQVDGGDDEAIVEPGELSAWVEGAAILAAVVLVVFANAINDYSRDRQFTRLFRERKAFDQVLVDPFGVDLAVGAGDDGTMKKSISSTEETCTPHLLSMDDLVVGHLVHLSPGDIVPADGLLIDVFGSSCQSSRRDDDSIPSLLVDESAMTGESDSVSKDLKSDPFLISGSRVVDGRARMMVTAVGISSFRGRMQLALIDATNGSLEDSGDAQISQQANRMDGQETPLQVKLDELAERIAKYGVFISGCMFLCLMIKAVYLNNLNTGRVLGILIETVTVIVVAVPEGLPMAVAVSLAFATKRMLADGNLVRVLAACETMGSVTTVCTDKTGTLTRNQMTVVESTVASSGRATSKISGDSVVSIDISSLTSVQSISVLGAANPTTDHLQDSVATTSTLNLLDNSNVVEEAVDDVKLAVGTLHQGNIDDGLIQQAVAINSTAVHDGDQWIGGGTEVALLRYIFHDDFSSVERLRRQYDVIGGVPFSSQRKYMSTQISIPDDRGGLIRRTFTKGAAEVILGQCERFRDASGNLLLMDDAKRRAFTRLLHSMAACNASSSSDHLSFEKSASGGLRTIAVSYQDEDDGGGGPVMLGLFGMRDPLRPGAATAVSLCHQAGIFVRMVTGDAKSTAQSVAKAAGILVSGGLCVSGAEFSSWDDRMALERLPKLQVVYRASPFDKKLLVERLRNLLGEVVAVTGGGANDGPALRAAHVSFSMGGVGGTAAAREASTIILVKDDFSAIVKAVAWGRCVHEAVQKFLQFQITVNVSAVVVAFVSSVFGAESVLGAVQLLWVNLIMDTLAALALATDRPTLAHLKGEPVDADASLIDPIMTVMIVGQALFQISVLFVLVVHWNVSQTMVFNSFVFMQLGNEICCRSLLKTDNVGWSVGAIIGRCFQGLHRNPIFVIIMAGTVATQFLIVTFGGDAFGTRPLSLSQWVLSVGLGLIGTWMAAVVFRFMVILWNRVSARNEQVTLRRSHQRRRLCRQGSGAMHVAREHLQWNSAIGSVRQSLRLHQALRRSVAK